MTQGRSGDLYILRSDWAAHFLQLRLQATGSQGDCFAELDPANPR